LACVNRWCFGGEKCGVKTSLQKCYFFRERYFKSLFLSVKQPNVHGLNTGIASISNMKRGTDPNITILCFEKERALVDSKN